MSEDAATVIVVDDEHALRTRLARLLDREGYRTRTYASGTELLAALDELLPDALLLDVSMPGMSGLQVLEQVRGRRPHLPVVMVTGETSVETVVSAMKGGAYDYLAKPFERHDLLKVVANAVEKSRLMQRVRSLEREARGPAGFGRILGSSPAMRELFRQMDRVGPSDLTVLITGETGTGKELVARALHALSSRAEGPFVALNCAAIPESLQESELFGHERGAFTGATNSRAGRFEEADGGTLLLDEVGELSPSTQATLLRAVQERSFRRVGGKRDQTSDFRLLAATHQDLEEGVRQGWFREDLYYRLAVYELEVPPLRDRRGDIEEIARGLVARWSESDGLVPPRQLTAAALRVLTAHRWPGNVRELENVLRRAYALARDDLIRPEDLPPKLGASTRAALASRPDGPGEEVDTLAEGDEFNLESLEQIAIRRAIRQADGNLSEVGRLLGIGRTTLYRKLKKYGIR